jgi:Homocysteine S-methyltransferase
MVAGIHEEYLRAGASVIETNTFSANRFKLEIHDLEDCVRQVNVAGARLARKAADDATSAEALVLGAIGPLGRPLAPIGPVSVDEAREVFLEQAEALLEGGADALLLETFPDLAELRLAYEAVRPLGVPVLAYKTFVEDGETLAEGLPERAAREISSWGPHRLELHRRSAADGEHRGADVRRGRASGDLPQPRSAPARGRIRPLQPGCGALRRVRRRARRGRSAAHRGLLRHHPGPHTRPLRGAEGSQVRH